MLANPAELLAAWEEGARLPPPARVAAVVRRAELADDLDAALDLPVGEGAALAARLYVELFGAEVEGVVRCAGCGEDLEVAISLADLGEAGGAATANVDGLLVRAPTSRDLLAAGTAADAREELLRRCVRDGNGEPVALDALGPERIAALDATAEELAGPAALVLRSRCPACGADATAPLDVGALLWEQVTRAARALIAEVAELAAAYGWSEDEVLALSPLRRREYLRVARGEG